jgi:phage terminase Nu1 subunit (DNA packaging protein)
MEKLLTTKDVMEIYAVTRTTVTDWRKQGMPFKKYGKLVRFDPNEISEWLENRG